MVTIQIGRKFQNFKGGIIPGPDGQATTIGDVLLQYLGTYVSKDGKSMLQAFAIGLDIGSCSAETIEVEIENADFTLIKEATQNPQHGALVMAQLMKALEEAEKTKTSPAGKKSAEKKDEPVPAK